MNSGRISASWVNVGHAAWEAKRNVGRCNKQTKELAAARRGRRWRYHRGRGPSRAQERIHDLSQIAPNGPVTHRTKLVLWRTRRLFFALALAVCGRLNSVERADTM
jgi:hypothetical protein